MASMSWHGTGNVNEVAEMLKEQILNSALSCTLVDSVTRYVGGYPLRLMVFDKYYMRVSNRASLTVALTGDGGTVWVDAISAGGGQGALFRFSWGAEEDFVTTVDEILRGHGFR